LSREFHFHCVSRDRSKPAAVVNRHRVVKLRRLASHLLYLSQTEVHHFLAERTDLAMPPDGGALTLNGDQVLKIISLAYGAK
jgi:hypothetical protein